MIKKIKDFLSNISIDAVVTCIYFLSLPFTVVTTPFGSLLKLITFPVAGVLGYKLFFGKRKELSFNSIHLVYSLYIVYVVGGLFLLITDMSVLQTKDMLLTYVVMMLISIRVYNDKERELMETAWIFVGIICVCLCLSSTEVANEFESRTIVYVLGFPEDPNQFCAYFIMPVMVCMKRIVEKRKLMPLYMVLLILIMYAVLKTGSRGGLIGLLIGIFMFIMFAVKSGKTKIAITATVILGAVFVIVVIFPMLPEDVRLRYSVEAVAEDKAAGRFDIWKFLVGYTAEKPSRLIHGSGLYSTYQILGNSNVVDKAGAAHNQFVQVLTDQGIIGLMLFFALICVCFFRSLKKTPHYACAFVAVMAFAVSLTMYVFKPYINIVIMCAMNFCTADTEQKEKITGNKQERGGLLR